MHPIAQDLILLLRTTFLTPVGASHKPPGARQEQRSDRHLYQIAGDERERTFCERISHIRLEHNCQPRRTQPQDEDRAERH